jgi:hypothetical protein
MNSQLATFLLVMGFGVQSPCIAQTPAQTAATETLDQRPSGALNASSESTPPTGDAAKTSLGPPTAPNLALHCEWLTPECAASSVDQLAPYLEQVRIASPTDFIPSHGPFTLLVFKAFVDKDNTPSGGQPLERLSYRALIVGTGSKSGDATALMKAQYFSQMVSPANIWSERATRGTSSEPGTDFKRDELPEGKTLLHIDADMNWQNSFPSLWQHARVYVIGTASSDASRPRIIGSFETVIADKRWAAALAILACAIVYIVAAVATYIAHQGQRVYDDDGGLAGQSAGSSASRSSLTRKPDATPRLFDRFRASAVNPLSGTDMGHGFLDGTNYKTVWAHIFNPVVLSAGTNGLGSATNLQILFFSIIVFGVVTYIWMMTGHLTGLSSTVVLLMGISGVGATAASGADLTKNRLSFDNWAWLINRDWLPPGGVAEVNAAKWKDIFTTNGAFDVYRFQMICFSVVVGISLIGVGAQVNDLTLFEIPQALLGILGLSQVVYIAGKLVAPPSISDLDAQISKLQDSERHLRELNETANSILAGTNVVTWTVDSKLSEAQKVYADYLEIWDRTKTMFQTTIGRLVPETAASKRPPFAISDIILSKLPKARANEDYQVRLMLAGMPGPGPYTWTIDSGTAPTNTIIEPAANNIDCILRFAAADAIQGEYRFTLRVVGPAPSQTITKDFFLQVVQSSPS